MATITRSGGNLKIDQSSTKVIYIPIDDVTLKITDELAILDNQVPKVVFSSHTEVTDPAASSLEDLADKVADLLIETTLGETSALTNVGASVTNVTIVAANPSRISVTIINDGVQNLFIKKGAVASLTSYTHKVPAGTSRTINDYSGIIDGIWNNANGTARITEITP